MSMRLRKTKGQNDNSFNSGDDNNHKGFDADCFFQVSLWTEKKREFLI